jgi:hypothetical protein
MAILYRQCQSCGNYFEVSDPSDVEEYCSTICKTEYVRCINCGNYFDKPEDFIEGDFICSAECGKKYKHTSNSGM